jgi:hypothetical protein
MYLDSTFILVSYLEVSSLCVSPAHTVDRIRYTIKQFTSEVASKLQNHDFFYLSIWVTHVEVGCVTWPLSLMFANHPGGDKSKIPAGSPAECQADAQWSWSLRTLDCEGCGDTVRSFNSLQAQRAGAHTQPPYHVSGDVLLYQLFFVSFVFFSTCLKMCDKSITK